MKKIKSLYYHNPQPAGFGKMIKRYHQRGYRFISISELYDILTTHSKVDERLAFVSLDDGWRGNRELIPIIEEYQVPICIFVATEPLISGNFWWEYIKADIGYKRMFEFKQLPYTEFYSRLKETEERIKLTRSALTADELIELSRHPLVTIQSHTVNHPILTSVPDDVLAMELRESQATIQSLTQHNVYAFSYPNGSLSDREVSACKQYYKMAFTTEQNDITTSGCDMYLLPRYALTGDYLRDLLKVWGVWKYAKQLKR